MKFVKWLLLLASLVIIILMLLGYRNPTNETLVFGALLFALFLPGR